MHSDLTEKAIYKYPFRGIDHLAWAKRINFRYIFGDKTLTAIQINFAKEALGNSWENIVTVNI